MPGAFHLKSQNTVQTTGATSGDLGTDTLNIYVGENVNTSFPSTATVRNVEIVNIYNGGNSDGTLTDASNYEGVQQLWQIGSESNVTNVGAGTAVGFRNITQEPLWADVTLAAGVTEATVVLENVGSGEDEFPDLEVDGNALTTVNVIGALNAGAEHLELTVWAGAGVRGLTINTTVDAHLFVEASEVDDSLVTLNDIDLSGSSGDVMFWIDDYHATQLVGAAQALNVALGSGNDAVVFEGRALSLRDTIDGGEGHDALGLVVSGTVQTQTYDAIARTANFETIVFLSDEGATIDAAELSGFENLAVGRLQPDVRILAPDLPPTFTIKNLSADVDLIVASDDLYDVGGPVQVVLDNAAANVNLALTQSDEASLDAAAALLSIGETKGATGGALTVEGDGVLAYSNAGGKFTTIDASTFGDDVGGMLLLGTTDFFVVAALDVDVPEYGAGLSRTVAETVLLGDNTLAGIVLDMGEGINSSSLALTDAIVGFSLANPDAEDEWLAQGDRILINVEGGLGEIHTANLSSAGSLQEALADAAALFADYEANDLLVFGYGGDTYLFGDTVNEGATPQYDGGDFLLQLVGVTNLNAVASQIGWEMPS